MFVCSTALIVIDVQESFRYRPDWLEAEMPPFVRNLQKLIGGAREQQIPTVRVLHVENHGDFPLSPATFSELRLPPNVNARNEVTAP